MEHEPSLFDEASEALQALSCFEASEAETETEAGIETVFTTIF